MRVECPHCSARYKVREDRIGTTFYCLKCGEEVTATAPPQPAEIAEPFPELVAAPEDTNRPADVDASAAAPPKRSFLKIVGGLAASLGLSVLVGFVSPSVGMTLMAAWMLTGLLLMFFGLVRLFMAIEGKQRFWLLLKMLLPLVGIKLFYFDRDLLNARTARAMGWMVTGVAVMFCSVVPLAWFSDQRKEALADNPPAESAPGHAASPAGAPLQQDGAAAPSPVTPRNATTPQAAPGQDNSGRPSVAGMPPGSGFGPGPGFAPGPGYGPGPGAVPGPGFGPGFDPGLMPPVPGMSGPLPIRFFYERLDYPTEDIRRRVDERFATFRFFRPGSVRINESRRSIEFLASYPPGLEETGQIRAAYGEAGVHLRTRPPR